MLEMFELYHGACKDGFIVIMPLS